MLEFIHYLLDLSTYNKYRDSINTNNDSKELSNLYKELDYLINTYQRTITFNEYKVHVLQKYPEYGIFLDRIETSDLGLEFVQDKFQELKEKQLAYELALLAVDVNEGNKPIQMVFDFYDKFESIKEANKEQIEFVTDDLEELYESTVKSPGLRWRLNTLNKMLGSLRQGDFGFIFARPETGKTTFLASEVTNFAEQTGKPILWFNNEEGGAKVKTRIYQASLGITLAQLYSNRKGNHKEYLKRTDGRIKLFDNASINKRQVEQIVKELKPDLIIFDQIDKIKGFDADREDLRLGSIYIWARELAKMYCPVIGVCQSDVSGEGKKWLTMDNVANAKTSKQAEADWILGIGTTHDPGFEYVRYLHASKNKLSGDEDSDPTLRHGRVEVLIKPDIARYSDLL